MAKVEIPKAEAVKCRVAIGQGETYTASLKDEKGNVTSVYLFYDPDLIPRSTLAIYKEMRVDVRAKPGDEIEIPKADFAVLERAGAVKGV